MLLAIHFFFSFLIKTTDSVTLQWKVKLHHFSWNFKKCSHTFLLPMNGLFCSANLQASHYFVEKEKKRTISNCFLIIQLHVLEVFLCEVMTLPHFWKKKRQMCQQCFLETRQKLSEWNIESLMNKCLFFLLLHFYIGFTLHRLSNVMFLL